MLRPFLLIGVGGSGGKTLRVIHDDLTRRLQLAGWSGELPKAWQFVHIDVPTMADGNDPDLPGQLPERDYQGLVAGGVDYRTIDTALTRASGSHVTDALGGWRPNPDRVMIPASKGAGQFRALGRIITLAGLGQIRGALERAVRQLTGAEVIGELQEVTRVLGGTPTTVVQEPTVIVVSSIAGGTGSGAVIDVCDAVRALGDKWANEIVGLLYAPDVFDDLPAEARPGVRPNALAAISELLSGYWNMDGPSEGTAQVFSKYGVQVGNARRLGPRYPFLVGARNEHVTYQTQNDIYQAMGRSLASWVASPVLQDRLSAYVQTQWAATAGSVPDRLPLHNQGTETPFVALGSARVGLGRDRFRDYASEHLARTVADRFLRRHEELRTRGDDRTEKQLVRDSADAVFGGFLSASGLDERGHDHNQIIDALRPAGLKDDLRVVYNDILRNVSDTISPRGARAVDVRHTIRNLVNDRHSHFQTAQLAVRLDTARVWVKQIQADLTALTARSITQNGAPVTAELLRRLTTEITQVRDEILAEASGQRRRAADVDQHVRGVLNDPDAATILQTTDRLGTAVKSAVNTFTDEQEAEVRELAAELIPDLAVNVLEPLIEAVEHGIESLSNEQSSGPGGRPSLMSLWPIGDIIPERLRSAPNEFLLESADTYPERLADLVRRTVGLEEGDGARREAEMQVLLGIEEIEGAVQNLVVRDTAWTPRNHQLHQSVTAAPARASYRVVSAPEDLLERSREWLHREGTTVGSYMAEGLREYLDPELVGPAELNARLQRFEGQLIAALNAGAPLVSINKAVLVQVHDRHKVSYTTSFGEIPLSDKSPAREILQRVLHARGEWNDGVAKAFSDGGGKSIDIFTVLSEPYEPVVFDSLMKPIASDWGAKSKSPAQRAEFWRWRRSRPLVEFLPFSPEVLHSLVRGWFVASLIGELQITEDGAKVYVPAPIGAGGEFAAFPWPTLSTVKPTGPDMMPALLESVNLAMLEVNSTESLAPMRPYERLLHLGGGSSSDIPELEGWILNGPDADDAVGASGWEARQLAAEQRLSGLSLHYSQHFDKVAQRNTLLDFPGSYELRNEIRAALSDLTRIVVEVQPASAAGAFY